jgi:hypothetical protein
MPTREEFLRLVWQDVINAPLTGSWIDNTIESSKRNPKGPFADAGLALEKLLAAGANRRDVNLVTRATIYETVFTLLYMLGDPGVDGHDVLMLHESLLGADPSGLEGRPGSTPQ